MLGLLFHHLSPFSPTLVGTYPLGLQVEGSDLDIACTCPDLDTFEQALYASLAELALTSARVERVALEPDATVATIAMTSPPIEIFCQPLPIHKQRGFRHMVIEGQLLVIGGHVLRDRVLAYKRTGVKTEPAFARVLGLSGDPYLALLALESWSPDRLRLLLEAALGPML